MNWFKKYFYFVAAFVFAGLFYNHYQALNMAIFNGFAIISMLLLNKELIKNKYFLFVSACLIILSVAMIWHANDYTFWINCIYLLLLSGSNANVHAKSLMYTGLQALDNFPKMFTSRYVIPENTQPSIINNPNRKKFSVKKFSIYFFPSIIVIVFILLYSGSNKYIYDLFNTLFHKLDVVWDFIKNLFPRLSIGWMFTVILGFLISMYLFQGIRKTMWILQEHFLENNLIRNRKKTVRNLSKSLNDEYKTGIFLFICLNALLIIVNFTDLNKVWLHFTWSNQLLREYVHEGTYMLITSILLGIVICLYYFRGNLNFYSKNALLKLLSQIWLWQNAFLTCSVIMRNIHYVNHYGLAYKRIGLFFFCVVILFAILFVSWKIFKKQTMYAFMKHSFFAAAAVVFVSAIPDWSMIIVNYNFAKQHRSYVDLNFISDMPDRCLPYINLNQEQLKKLMQTQNILGFDFRDYRDDGISYDQYIKNRIVNFETDYPTRNSLDYTIADEKAYLFLKNKK